MRYKITKSKIDKVRRNKIKLESNLENKSNKNYNSIGNVEFNNPPIKIFDSGWTVAEVETIEGATTQTENLVLPQRAKYNFNFPLNVPESYLSFLDYKIILISNCCCFI